MVDLEINTSLKPNLQIHIRDNSVFGFINKKRPSCKGKAFSKHMILYLFF